VTGFSIVSDGLACIAGALTLSALLPGFRRDATPAAPAAEVACRRSPSAFRWSNASAGNR
jgi:hypothetical protein